MVLKQYEEEDIRAIANAIRLNPLFNNKYSLKKIPQTILNTFHSYRDFFRAWIENDSVKQSITFSKLPEGLIGIKSNTFNGWSKLALTSLPESLTSIGRSAFMYCTNLALTELPKNLTSIDTYAFFDCPGLKEITFKGTLNYIASQAFAYCDNLTTINVPWSEGEVANAPWGATNATINYNYMEVLKNVN